jgi:hypothetical protein
MTRRACVVLRRMTAEGETHPEARGQSGIHGSKRLARAPPVLTVRFEAVPFRA